jgi:hypothetical protein
MPDAVTPAAGPRGAACRLPVPGTGWHEPARPRLRDPDVPGRRSAGGWPGGSRVPLR